MKRILLVLALVAANLAPGQTAADKIAAGRAALVAHDMPTARARFQEALTLAPANQTAAALLGLTRLFDLTSLAATGTFLDGVGVTGTGRDVYHWQAELPTDDDGGFVLPANYNLSQIAGYWQNTFAPESQLARGNLALVTDPNFLITLTAAETKLPVSTNVDYADLLMARACLSGAEFMAHFGAGQNMDANLDTILQVAKGDMLTLQRVFNDNPNFLKIGSTSERAAAQAALQDMITLYRQASAAIRARPAGLNRLFMFTAGDLAAEAEFRQALDQIELSFTSAVQVGDQALLTGPLFGANWSLRAQLPVFSATGFDVTTIPEASFGEILAGSTKEKLAAAMSDPHDTLAEMGWEWVTPKPQGSTLYRYLALPGGKHLAVGNGGAYLTSSDGTNWTAGRVPGVGQILDVTANAGEVVAVTYDGTIYASTDSGATWRRVFWANNRFVGVTYGGGQFVAVGNNGLVATSTDGESWNETYPIGLYLSHVLYTGSLYVAVGEDFSANAAIATSPDAITWTVRFSTSLSDNQFTGVAQGAGVLVAVTNGATQRAISSDGGLTWSLGATPSAYGDVAYRAGLFVAVGNGGTIATSPNGTAWTNAISGETIALTGVSAGASATYAVGQGGVILSSTDNVTFTRALTLQPVVSTLAVKNQFALKVMDGQLYAGGGSNTNGGTDIIRSADGQNFTAATTPGGLSDIQDFLKHGTTYYAVGKGGTILTSTDSGANWTQITSGTVTNLNAIAYLNGKFIAVGNGSKILTSPDGATGNWTTINLGVGGMQMNGVAYGNGVYVAVGGSNNAGNPFNYVLTSTDAATWTQQFAQTPETFKGIVFYQGVFTAVGTGGVVRRSTDGINWWNAGVGDIQTNLTSISVLDGKYYATQANSNLDGSVLASQAAVLISSNGENWVRVPQGAANQPNRVELFGGRLYTAGSNATILRTEAFAPLAAPVVQVLTPSKQAQQGDTLTLAVATTGEGALTYQWQKDNADISDATGPALTLDNIQPGAAGSYTLKVTNSAGTVTSAPIVVTVNATATAPVITSQPESQTVSVGLNTSLSVEASGTTPYSYQWKKDGVSLADGGSVSGATSATLVLSPLSAANGGTYTVVVTNAGGNTTSLPAVLTVDSNPAYQFSTLAGSAGNAGSNDGTGSGATFSSPNGAAVDASGNLYTCSPDSHTVRKITPGGVVTTIAGLANNSGSTNATGSSARFNGPRGVALDAAGTTLYVADTNNSSIRKINLSTFAVTTWVTVNSPTALVLDSAGNAYVTSYDHSVRKITSGASVSVLAGAAGQSGSTDGTGGSARFNSPQGIAIDSTGTNLYVADSSNATIRQIVIATAAVTTYAGQPGNFGYDDGPVNRATLSYCLGVAVDGIGNVFVTDNSADIIRKISPAKIVSTIGGQAYSDGYNDGVGADARFSGPAGLAVDSSGKLLFGETYNRVIRKGTPLTSLLAPIVGLPPQSQTVNAGTNVTLSVIATGTSTLSYQWRKDGMAIDGATGSTYTLINAQPADAGSYAVLVTSTQGNALSAPATLNVTVPPAITMQPLTQTVTAGQGITLSVTATDVGDITYEWRRNGLPIPGAIYSTYSIPASQRSDAGVYDVVLNGVGGTGYSGPAVVSVAPTSYPGNLTIDPSFNGSPLLTLSCRIFTALALPDGKWLVGGEFVRWDSTPRSFLARLNADYSLDTNFTPPVINGFVYALARAPDGSIYVGGEFTAVDGNVVPGLFRLNSSFALDLTWRAQDAPPNASVTALTVQADGKPLVARAATTSYQTAPIASNADALRRLNTDGTLDSSFTVALALSNRLNAIAVEAGGSIVFAGGFSTVNGTSHPNIARVNSTGATLDTAFAGATAGANNTVFSLTPLSGGGYLIGGNFGSVAGSTRNRAAIINSDGSLNSFAPVSLNGNVLGAAQQSDGKIILAGTFSTANGSPTDGLVRLTSAGAVDRFYATGAASSSFNTVSSSRSTYVFPQADGSTAIFGSFQAALNHQRIGVAVVTSGGSLASSPAPLLYRPSYINSAFALGGGQAAVFGSIDAAGVTGPLNQTARINDDGTLDATFPDGSGYNNNGLSHFGIYRTVQQGDGKFLAVGDLAGFDGQAAYRLVRINADGSFDDSFNAGGGPSSVLTPLLALSGGRTLIYGLGVSNTFNGRNVGAIVRLEENGSIDDSLNLGTGINAGSVTSAYEQPDGKLVLAGNFTTYNGTTVNGLMRLNEDGSLDGTFSAGTGVSSITGITGLPDGRLVLAGNFTTYNGAAANRMAIISPTGSLDGSFTAPAEINGQVGQVLAQEDGKFILIGDFTGTPLPYAVRLSATGTIDSTFALRGITEGFGSSSRIFLGDDGSLYVYSGTPVSYNYGVPLALARFRGAPVAPTVATAPAGATVGAGAAVTLSVNAGGTAPFTYQWRRNNVDIDGANYSVLNLANLSTGDAGSYTVVVTNSQDSVTSAPAILTVTENFPAWQQAHFTAGELADSNKSGPNAVYGLDGQTNLVKYALGLDPKTNATLGLPVVSTTATDWICTYTRPTDRTDLTYSVEVSTNLTTWTTTNVTLELVSTSGGIDTWRAHYPLASATTAFFRLKITH